MGLSAPADENLSDSSQVVHLRRIWFNRDSSKGDTLYVGLARFALIDNSQVELSVRGTTDHVVTPYAADPVYSVYANIANERRHTFELGILGAGSYGARIPTYNSNQVITSESPRVIGNAYVTFDVNLPFLWFRPPAVPAFYEDSATIRASSTKPDIGWRDLRPTWQRFSMGVFIGTNVLQGAFGNEFAYGVQVGHLIGEAGLAIGYTRVPTPRLVGTKTINERLARFLTGIDVRL